MNVSTRADARRFAFAARPAAKDGRVEINLPAPPSTNQLYTNLPGRGRIKSKMYKSWINAAGWRLNFGPAGKIEGRYRLTVFVNPNRGDIDNRVKAISDLLVTNGVVLDDKYADAVSVKRDESIPHSDCRVVVEALKEISL